MQTFKTFRKWYEDKYKKLLPLYIQTEEKKKLQAEYEKDNPLVNEKNKLSK